MMRLHLTCCGQYTKLVVEPRHVTWAWRRGTLTPKEISDIVKNPSDVKGQLLGYLCGMDKLQLTVNGETLYFTQHNTNRLMRAGADLDIGGYNIKVFTDINTPSKYFNWVMTVNITALP